MLKSFLYYLVLLFSKLIISESAEDDKLIYTSIPDMVNILSTAFKIQENVEHLNTHYRTKLRDVAEVFQHLKTAQADNTRSILHPIFFLKNILSIDRILKTKNQYTKKIKNLKDDLSKLTQTKIKTNRLKIDDHIKVLFALQDFYNFDMEQIADGILKDSSINISLSVLDCYEIGSWALENKDAYHAKLWLNEAKRRLILKSADSTVRLEEILLKLANVYSIYKNENKTRQHIQQILKIDPNNEAALQFEVVLEASGTFYNMISDTYKITPTIYNWGGSSNRKWVQQLCQQKQTFNVTSSIGYCYYHELYTYYYVKVEVVRIKPVVGILHEIITNREILAFHQQAALQNPVSLGRNHSTVIHSESNKIIEGFKRKISRMAISTTILDPFLYTHFDIGEFYKLKRRLIKGDNNFIATNDDKREFLLMLFLNNVEGGGRVIFPRLNISIAPQKGNALIWDNVPGKPDKDSFHTICPIYAGNCTVVLVRGYSNEYYK